MHVKYNKKTKQTKHIDIRPERTEVELENIIMHNNGFPVVIYAQIYNAKRKKKTKFLRSKQHKKASRIKQRKRQQISNLKI